MYTGQDSCVNVAQGQWWRWWYATNDKQL